MAPLPPPPAAGAFLGREAAVLGPIPASKEREEADAHMASIAGAIQVAAAAGDAAALGTALSRLPEVPGKIQTARVESLTRAAETDMRTEGGRFNTMIGAHTQPETWADGTTDTHVDVGHIAGNIDLATLPPAVRDGMRTMIDLEAQSDVGEVAKTNIDMESNANKVREARVEITLNRLKQFGNVMKYIGIPALLAIIVGLTPAGAAIGLATGGLGAAIGSTMFYFDKGRFKLREKVTAARKKIIEAGQGNVDLRKNALQRNFSTVAGIEQLQQEFLAMSLGDEVKNSPRLRQAFYSASGFTPAAQQLIRLTRGGAAPAATATTT